MSAIASRPAEVVHDLRWRRRELGALLALAVAGWSLAVASSLAPRWPCDTQIAIDKDRAELAAERIDPNTAGEASLRRLSDIGPVRAAAIVAYRRAKGGRPFRWASDLQAVRGIGPATVEKNLRYLSIPARP